MQEPNAVVKSSLYVTTTMVQIDANCILWDCGTLIDLILPFKYIYILFFVGVGRLSAAEKNREKRVQ